MPRGVRLNPKHDDRTRAKIQASQIVNRLQKHVNGEVEMTSSQIKAAEILLKKTLPDLSAVSIGSDPSYPITHVHSINLSDQEIIDRFLQNHKVINH